MKLQNRLIPISFAARRRVDDIDSLLPLVVLLELVVEHRLHAEQETAQANAVPPLHEVQVTEQGVDAAVAEVLLVDSCRLDRLRQGPHALGVHEGLVVHEEHVAFRDRLQLATTAWMSRLK